MMIIADVIKTTNRTDKPHWISDMRQEDKVFEFNDPVCIEPSQSKTILLDMLDYSGRELLPGSFFLHNDGVRNRILRFDEAIDIAAKHLLNIDAEPKVLLKFGIELERFHGASAQGLRLIDLWRCDGKITYK